MEIVDNNKITERPALPVKCDIKNINGHDHMKKIGEAVDMFNQNNIGIMKIIYTGKSPVHSGLHGLNYEDKKAAYDNTNHGHIAKSRKNNDLINIGIQTGKANNITVLDFDFFTSDKQDYRDNIDGMIEFHNTIISKTSNPLIIKSHSGGRHLIYQYAPLMNRANATTLGISGVDVRSSGGICVSVGSLCEYGYYEIVSGDFGNIPVMPDEVKDWFQPYREAAKKKKKDKKDEYGIDTPEYEEYINDKYDKQCSKPYIKFILQNLPAELASNYSDWWKIISWVRCSVKDKEFGNLVYKFSKRSTELAHTNRSKDDIINDCFEKTKGSKQWKEASSQLYSILHKTNKNKHFELLDMMKRDRIDGGDEEFDVEWWKKLGNYQDMKDYFELYYVCVGGNCNMIFNKKSMACEGAMRVWFDTKKNCKSQVVINEGTENEKIKMKPFSSIYLDEDGKRMNYLGAGIYFDKPPKGHFNLFTGIWAKDVLLKDESIIADPIKGKILYDLYYDILYSKEEADYVLDLMARWLLCPHQRTGVMLILWCKATGAGKSTLLKYFKKIITGFWNEQTHHAVGEYTYSKYVAQFNYATVAGKLICNVEEVPEKKISGGQETFKNFIKQDVVDCESKGVDPQNVKMIAQWIATTNNPHCAIENKDKDERSTMFAKVKNIYCEDKEFWDKFHDALDDQSAFKWFCEQLLLRQSVIGRTPSQWEKLVPDDPNAKLTIKVPPYALVLRTLKKDHRDKEKGYYKDGYYLLEEEYFKSRYALCQGKGPYRDKHTSQQEFSSGWVDFAGDKKFETMTEYFPAPIKDKKWFVFNYDGLFSWLELKNYTDPIKETEHTEKQKQLLSKLFENECDIDNDSDIESD